MEAEGELSLLLHHKLATTTRSEGALVEYYGEDHGRGSIDGGRRLPWEERMRTEAQWKTTIRRDGLPPSPAAGKGPTASPARRSSRSFVSDANGVMLLGEDAETLARRSGVWRTPAGDATLNATRSPGAAGSNAGGGLSGSAIRRTASRTPRPSPSTRAVPRLADSKPEAEDLRAAEEETAFLLGQAFRLGLSGMLENTQQAEEN